MVVLYTLTLPNFLVYVMWCIICFQQLNLGLIFLLSLFCSSLPLFIIYLVRFIYMSLYDSNYIFNEDIQYLYLSNFNIAKILHSLSYFAEKLWLIFELLIKISNSSLWLLKLFTFLSELFKTQFPYIF